MRREHDYEREHGPHLHCEILAALSGIGAALGVGTAGTVTAAGVVAGGLAVGTVAGSLASTGLSISQAVNRPEIPQAPTVLDGGAKARQRGAQRRFAGARTRNVVAPRPTLGASAGTTAAPTTLGASDLPSIP